MREVNFSIPNVNKASVGITTALYDRRALDCTSTLPLINSLNHLAYLTTSSARIRDILTVDGGVERLVCLLKAGRSKDMMDMWKWNLAFQCVVNIGVRGSENVRTRVVEADMVPVIATILDNYIKVVDRCREKAEEAKQKALLEHRHQNGRSGEHRSTHKGRHLAIEHRDLNPNFEHQDANLLHLLSTSLEPLGYRNDKWLRRHGHYTNRASIRSHISSRANYILRSQTPSPS
ncbi:MYND finger [Botrytis cinerea]